MQVTLAHEPNPDIDGGYWDETEDDGSETKAQIDSFKEAREQCLGYIFRNQLGAGNWAGGKIFKDGVQVAFVSYNGRVWEGTTYEGAKEIEV